MSMRKGKTLVEFRTRYGKHSAWVDPDAVEAISWKTNDPERDGRGVTIIMLRNGSYLCVDGTEEEAARRIEEATR